MTKVQKITIVAIVLYIAWEIAVQVWAKKESGPIIRADLLLVIPVLSILIVWSLIQWLRAKK